MKVAAFLFMGCLGLNLLHSAQAQIAAPSAVEKEKLLDSLIPIDFGSVYVEDGAADGSVTEEWRESESGPEAQAFGRVKALVELKAAALPL
jgi:hypothetical protein